MMYSSQKYFTSENFPNFSNLLVCMCVCVSLYRIIFPTLFTNHNSLFHVYPYYSIHLLSKDTSVLSCFKFLIKKYGSTFQIGMGQVQNGCLYKRYKSSSMKNKVNKCKILINYIPWLFFCYIYYVTSANLYQVGENLA